MCKLSFHPLPQLLSCCRIYEGSRPKKMRIRKALGIFLGISDSLSAMAFRFLISSFAIWLKGLSTSQQLALQWAGLVSVLEFCTVYCRNAGNTVRCPGRLSELLSLRVGIAASLCCGFSMYSKLSSLPLPSTFPGLRLTPALPGSPDC